MNRPSHWIIALFAVMGPTLWVWGLTEGFGDHGDQVSPPPQRARLLATPRTNQEAPVEVQLSGRVIDARGEPVAGAEIRVIGGQSVALARSNGTFEVFVRPGDPCGRIEITADGYAGRVERCALSDLQHFVVALAPAAPWQVPAAVNPTIKAALGGEGYVYAAGRPLAGVAVTALETGDTALTDDVGRFLIPLGASRVSLAAWHPAGRASVLESISPAQSEGVISLGVSELGDGAQVSGSVRLPDGSPAPGAAVVLRNQGLVRRALTDTSAMFQVGGLVAGDYVLEVLPCAGALGIKQPLHVVSSGQVPELRLVAEKPHRVLLVDRTQAPHARAFVVAVDAGERRAWAQADAAGVATLRGLAADGLRIEEVRSPEHAVLEVVGVAAEGDLTTVVAAK